MEADAGLRKHLGRACALAAASPARKTRSLRWFAANALLIALALQAADLRADLLFRSAGKAAGGQNASTPRSYANPEDTRYPRILADGTELASEEVQVIVQGSITQEDAYGARVMESLVRRGRQKIAGNLIFFSGNGGNVDAAMEVGRVLRRLRVSTLVAGGEQCLSSCVFAFMGGDQRKVDGRLGIHRPYFSSTHKDADRRKYYRQLQRRLQNYIEELEYPSSLYEAIMAVPPQSMSILSTVDLKRFYLHGMSPAAEDEADAREAGNLGISLREYLQRKAQALPCAGIIDASAGCKGEIQQTAGTRGAGPDASPEGNQPPQATGSAVLPQ